MESSKKAIYVTQPSLCTQEEYFEILKSVWANGILTHNGPKVREFEEAIISKLSINNFVAVTNGTIALQMAIKALGLKGEIITPAFTWIATVSAIKWENCDPVFCDINSETLNIEPNEIEKLITPKTVAIMPVHVFGNPCDVLAIKKIAEKYNLKIIYDAAHAIGSKFKGDSILNYGDISATSLHATKILNTAEGGGCITVNKDINEKLKRIRFFGHNNDKTDIIDDGFNGKMTEVHAALGLANINYFNQVIDDRKIKYNFYLESLSQNKKVFFQKHNIGTSNYSYFPVIFQNEKQLLTAQNALNKKNIFPRRYFFPSVNTFKKVVKYKKVPKSENVSKRILCLPLYFRLSFKDIKTIAAIINSSI